MPLALFVLRREWLQLTVLALMYLTTLWLAVLTWRYARQEVNQDAASAKAARALAVQIMLRPLYVPGHAPVNAPVNESAPVPGSLSAASACLLALQNASKTRQLQGALKITEQFSCLPRLALTVWINSQISL